MYQDDKYINDLRPKKNHLLVHDEENISHSLFEWCQPLEHKEQTMLLVEDGMDAETLKKIFAPFFTTKPVGAGTCFHIGLPIEQVEQRSEIIAN